MKKLILILTLLLFASFVYAECDGCPVTTTSNREQCLGYGEIVFSENMINYYQLDPLVDNTQEIYYCDENKEIKLYNDQNKDILTTTQNSVTYNNNKNMQLISIQSNGDMVLAVNTLGAGGSTPQDYNQKTTIVKQNQEKIFESVKINCEEILYHTTNSYALCKFEIIKEQSTQTSSDDLSDYPSSLSGKEVVLVLGDAAPSSDVIAASSIVQQIKNDVNIVAKSTLISEISAFTNHFKILVGIPCDNELIVNALGWEDCSQWPYRSGEALIQIYNQGIIVAGSTANDVRMGANALAEHNGLNGDKMVIQGDKENFIVTDKIRIEKELEETITPPLELPETTPTQLAESDICVDNKCGDEIEEGFFTKIINWFKRLFGG